MTCLLVTITTGITFINFYVHMYVTEEIGLEVIGNLHSQRETIERSRNRVSDLTKKLYSVKP